MGDWSFMYRILIADDEGIAIDSITFILEHSFENQCEIRSARTGRSVIELAESFRPDIAVMDIQMPGINGIEAIREIRKFSPQTIFLVVSAYDKFSYAKEAIDLGVASYLTKPLEREAFVDAMSSAMRQLDKDRARRNNDLKTLEKLETVVPLIETGLVYSLLLQDTSEEDINQYRNLLEIEETSGFMMLIEFGDENEESDKNAGRKLDNPIGSGIRIQRQYTKIRELIKDYSAKAVVGQIMRNKIPVFVPHEDQEPDYNERNAIIERCRELVRRLEERTEIDFRIGIGTVRPMKEIKTSYQEARESLRADESSVSHADDLPVVIEYEESYPIDLERALFEYVKSGDTERVRPCADSFFAWMEETQAAAHEPNVRLKALEFVLWADHIAYQDGGMGIYRFTDRQDYLGISQQYTMTELHRWFVERIVAATEKIARKTTNRADTLIDDALAYIGKNFQNDISLDDVSRTIDISPYYFSKLFKEKTGVTFVEYLTRTRMEKAKELLRDSENSIRDVCFAVGYQDPNYFSRIFKRSTGSTPSEFRG